MLLIELFLQCLIVIRSFKRSRTIGCLFLKEVKNVHAVVCGWVSFMFLHSWPFGFCNAFLLSNIVPLYMFSLATDHEKSQIYQRNGLYEGIPGNVAFFCLLDTSPSTITGFLFLIAPWSIKAASISWRRKITWIFASLEI